MSGQDLANEHYSKLNPYTGFDISNTGYVKMVDRMSKHDFICEYVLSKESTFESESLVDEAERVWNRIQEVCNETNQ